jgi:hypothetical protein
MKWTKKRRRTRPMRRDGWQGLEMLERSLAETLASSRVHYNVGQHIGAEQGGGVGVKE